jgi:hypothetical protein
MEIQTSIRAKSTGPSICRSVSRRSPSRKIDDVAEPCFREMILCGFCLFGFVLGADHQPATATGPHIVAHGRCQIERRNPKGGADLDNSPNVARPAKLIAERRLVAIQRHQFIASELLDTRGIVFVWRRRIIARRLALRSVHAAAQAGVPAPDREERLQLQNSCFASREAIMGCKCKYPEADRPIEEYGLLAGPNRADGCVVPLGEGLRPLAPSAKSLEFAAGPWSQTGQCAGRRR